MDARNLWPDTARVVADVRPSVVTLENVPGLLRFDYFGQILADLSALGFRVAWSTLSAADLGAPHIRDRLWIAGLHESATHVDECDLDEDCMCQLGFVEDAIAKMDSYAYRWGRETVRIENRERNIEGACGDEPHGLREPWTIEPAMGRVAHGVAGRLDRLRCLGNGQVPIVAAIAWANLLGRLLDEDGPE